MLAPDDRPPFRVLLGQPGCPFVLTADHAGRAIPRALGRLGLTDAELDTHIACDLGIAGVSERLATKLGAFLILQSYSRLVIDCNRPLTSDSSIATVSEYTKVPGNAGLSPAERDARADSIFHPYHQRIQSELERRERGAEAAVLLTMHSFTPCFKGVQRPWHCGVLYHRDARLARPLIELLRAEGLCVGDNEPYFVSDETDYGIPRYGEQRGHLHAELELRQDLILEEAQQEQFAELLARVSRQALAAVARA